MTKTTATVRALIDAGLSDAQIDAVLAIGETTAVRGVAEQYSAERTNGRENIRRAAESWGKLEEAHNRVMASEPTARRPRIVSPAKGYWPTDAKIGKRGGPAIPELPPNSDTVLRAVIQEPGISTRRIAEKYGLKLKAVESALDWLRTHDADRESTVRNTAVGVREPIRGRKPLIVSRARE